MVAALPPTLANGTGKWVVTDVAFHTEGRREGRRDVRMNERASTLRGNSQSLLFLISKYARHCATRVKMVIKQLGRQTEA